MYNMYVTIYTVCHIQYNLFKKKISYCHDVHVDVSHNQGTTMKSPLPKIWIILVGKPHEFCRSPNFEPSHAIAKCAFPHWLRQAQSAHSHGLRPYNTSRKKQGVVYGNKSAIALQRTDIFRLNQDEGPQSDWGSLTSRLR